MLSHLATGVENAFDDAAGNMWQTLSGGGGANQGRAVQVEPMKPQVEAAWN
jgi:hypothetical protein